MGYASWDPDDEHYPPTGEVVAEFNPPRITIWQWVEFNLGFEFE